MFFAVSSVYIFFLFGLGYFATHVFHLNDEASPLVEKFPLIFITGMVANYLILILSQLLTLSLLLGGLMSVGGLVWFLMRRQREVISGGRRGWLPMVVIAVILILYYFAILYDPLEDWDARSIWFFHAKMIWSAGSLGMNAGWDHPSLQWSHVDYPKLIPAMAAQLTYILGYWNEYAPKFALFLLLIPAVLWIFSFYNRRFSFLFLVLIFPFGLKTHLWNGFMDGYIAIYAAIAVLLLGRYLQANRPTDLISAIGCFALLSNIKNEGIVIALVGMVSFFVAKLLSKNFKSIESKNIFSPHRIGWLTMMVVPCLVWSVFYKHQWHLANDLQIGTRQSLFRIAGRLFDGESFPLILKATFFHDESNLCLSLVAFMIGLIAMLAFKRRPFYWVPALMTAFVYYCCIVLIYLLTPNDLNWHLATSVQRTMLTVSSCVFAGVYFVLNELEKASEQWTLQNHHHVSG